jgi:hypothetical protein
MSAKARQPAHQSSTHLVLFYLTLPNSRCSLSYLGFLVHIRSSAASNTTGSIGSRRSKCTAKLPPSRDPTPARNSSLCHVKQPLIPLPAALSSATSPPSNSLILTSLALNPLTALQTQPKKTISRSACYVSVRTGGPAGVIEGIPYDFYFPPNVNVIYPSSGKDVWVFQFSADKRTWDEEDERKPYLERKPDDWEWKIKIYQPLKTTR